MKTNMCVIPLSHYILLNSILMIFIYIVFSSLYTRNINLHFVYSYFLSQNLLINKSNSSPNAFAVPEIFLKIKEYVYEEMSS